MIKVVTLVIGAFLSVVNLYGEISGANRHVDGVRTVNDSERPLRILVIDNVTGKLDWVPVKVENNKPVLLKNRIYRRWDPNLGEKGSYVWDKTNEHAKFSSTPSSLAKGSILPATFAGGKPGDSLVLSGTERGLGAWKLEKSTGNEKWSFVNHIPPPSLFGPYYP